MCKGGGGCSGVCGVGMKAFLLGSVASMQVRVVTLLWIPY